MRRLHSTRLDSPRLVLTSSPSPPRLRRRRRSHRCCCRRRRATRHRDPDSRLHSLPPLLPADEPSFSISREPGFGYPIVAGMTVTLKCEIGMHSVPHTRHSVAKPRLPCNLRVSRHHGRRR